MNKLRALWTLIKDLLADLWKYRKATAPKAPEAKESNHQKLESPKQGKY